MHLKDRQQQQRHRLRRRQQPDLERSRAEVEGGAETRWAEDFELLPLLFGSPAPRYALVCDVRDEGVTVAAASNRRVLDALAMAGDLAETWTGRRFRPERKTIKIDGVTISDKALKLDAGSFVAQVGKRKFARVTLVA